MAKKIRFPLEMADGAQVRNLEELQAHFDLQSVLEYYKTGKLLTWLRDRYCDGEAAAVEALDESASDLQQKLCEIFGVAYTGETVDLEEITRRQERLARLRTFTDEAEFIDHIDQVAFDQEELADLLDEEETVIYLCGEKFTVPASRKGITYIGVNTPDVHISGKLPEDTEKLGIQFKTCDVENLPSKSSTEHGSYPDMQASFAADLDEVADKAFYAISDREGLSVCVETENYIMYLDREIGWNFHNLNKHLYHKHTGQDQVTTLKTVREGEKDNLQCTFVNFWRKSDKERNEILHSNDVQNLLEFLVAGYVAAIDGDTVYYAVPNTCRETDSDFPEYEGLTTLFSYDPKTDERKEVVSYNASYSGLSRKKHAVVADGYFAYLEKEKGLCLLNLKTGEQRKILANGENVYPHDFDIMKSHLYFTKGLDDIFIYDIATHKCTQSISDIHHDAGFLAVYEDMLYWGRFKTLKCMTLNSQVQTIQTLFNGEDIKARGYEDGILYATTDSEYPLYFLDKSTGETVQIGKGCGYSESIRDGLFQSHFCKKANSFCRIGQTVFFNYGHDSGVYKVRINRPMEMERIPNKDENGRTLSPFIL